MSRVAARCPSCQSVFFVSAAQGKVANNLVRCGRCGHLFSVLENLSSSLPEPELVADPPKPEIDVAPDPEAEPEPELVAQEGAELDATRVPGFALPNVPTRLSDDFELNSPCAKSTNFGRELSLAVLIVIVALAGLGAQYVFFKLPTLSQQLAYRPWLQTFCTLVPCELAAYSAPSLVSVERLQVRAHPDLEGSLVVELVLTNMARVEQVYPPLILRFDDLQGEQVAARRLFAKEYLPSNIRVGGLMPVDKAVSIKLGILDPGERALSYSVSVAQ